MRAIGVSNFMVEHLTALLDRTSVVPAVNQVEVHPYFRQRQVQAFDAEHGILSQTWSPIGGITPHRAQGVRREHLRRRNKQLEQENEVLRRATAYFARDAFPK